MTRRILIVPVGHDVGLTSASLGLVHALDQNGVDVGFCKPLAQPPHAGEQDHSASVLRKVMHTDVPVPVDSDVVERCLHHDDLDTLMEEVLTRCDATLTGHDVVVIEGLVPSTGQTYSSKLNVALAKALDAEVMLVVSANADTPEHLAERLSTAQNLYKVGESHRVLGALINRVPEDTQGLSEAIDATGVPVVGWVRVQEHLTWPRVRDVVRNLNLDVLHEGDLDRRVRNTAIAAQAVPGLLKWLTEGQMIVVPGDRHDVMLSAALTSMNGTRLAAILLTAGVELDPDIMELCRPALDSGLPLLLSPDLTYDTARRVLRMDDALPVDDVPRMRDVMEAVAAGFCPEWIAELPLPTHSRRMSPAAFRRQLTEKARAVGARIVLPEGAEPRTVQAAVICHAKGIAKCVLLAPRRDVEATAAQLGVTLPDDLDIIDPTSIDERYVTALVERRKAKGMTPTRALDELSDSVMLGTVMVYLGEVDGLVSGAVHTTANTVRPAFQVLGTAPDSSIVSSVFFMGLPDDVVLYGDCAINPDPTADELADIAIQSADSATAFGIEPRVAMISYSSGTSGSGADVEKVKQATDLVRSRRPDILVDGPLQYDAATTASVARSKAPDSQVAGRASVIIFPDLNTGNTTYKAVQRSAGVISIGPMLQGLAKPVNDLSRGALVEDIVYTIAITAIQSA